jgi:RimJ/RimL family protein N-acetyltransferase
MDSNAGAFRESVLARLSRMKAGPYGGPTALIRVPLDDSRALVLRPVAPGPGADADRDIELITAWRNRHRESFLTWFTATSEGTRLWLEAMRQTEDRILFMIEADGIAFGHLGVCHFDVAARSCEVDSVARGLDDVLPGGMTLALKALLNWVFGELNCAETFVRVFADNTGAVALYERCGFRLIRTVPLEPVTENAVVRWVEQVDTKRAESGRRLAYMVAASPSHS